MKRLAYDFFKRIVDIIVSALGLIVLSPLLAAVAIAVKINMGSPVLFRQPRPGLEGKIFLICKFRTMKDEYSDGLLVSDEKRLTPLGNFLRSFSLDELPELWNVLKGDMSLVGPRPLRAEYLHRYTSKQARRHEVKPGITGWAQINGRNLLSWEERFQMDIWYVDHRSLCLDLKIVFMTFALVIKREGISGKGSATMTEFLGTAKNAVSNEGRSF